MELFFFILYVVSTSGLLRIVLRNPRFRIQAYGDVMVMICRSAWVIQCICIAILSPPSAVIC